MESGRFSRFYVDDNIPKYKYNELYGLWIINSVSKQIADVVLVCKIKSSIIGFVTLKIKNDFGAIGIIAVNETYRGYGVGKSLMYSAENWFKEKGVLYIQVVTQNANFSGKKLYENCKYTLEKKEFFYHIWL